VSEKETQATKKVALSAKAIEKMKNDSYKADIGENEGLRVYKGKTGLTSFIYRYRSPIDNSLKKMKIGTFPELSLAEARIKLQKLKAQRRSGICPSTYAKEEKLERLTKLQAEKEKEELHKFTVKDLIELYLTNVIEDRYVEDPRSGLKKLIRGSRKKKGQDETRRTLYGDAVKVLGHLPAEKITRKDIVQLVSDIVARGANVQAGRVLSELTLAYEYAIGLEKFKEDFANPALLAKASVKQARLKLTCTKGTRVLSDDELRRVLQWLPTSGFSAKHKQVLMITLWTGCRTGEVCEAKWADINLESRTWHIRQSKNGSERYVQLSRQCAEFIAELPNKHLEYVFQMEKSGKSLLQKTITECKWRMKHPEKMVYKQTYRPEQLWLNDMPDWNPHDLRRTVRTGLSRLGCPAEVAEAVLGHSKKGIQGTYDLHTYEKECAEWLQKWADYIDFLLTE
jgi:integrase